MSASNSTLEMAAYNAFITAVWRGQLYQYVNIATLTVFVADYIGTLDFEIAYMWPFKFNLVSILFILTRYMPVADLIVMTYTERSMGMTQSLCSNLARSYVWLIYAGMAIAEGLLTLRVWALYGKGKKLTAFMITVYGGSFAASAVIIYKSLDSLRVTIVNIPGLPRLCATTSYDQLLYLYWVFMIVVDAVSCIMLLVQLISAYKTGGLTNLMKVVYQDGVIFYLVLLCFSVVNIFSIIMLPADISSLLTAPERIIHAVLAGRVVLHTRHQAHEDKLASMITLHTIASFDAARPEQFSHAGGGMAGVHQFSGTGNLYTSPAVSLPQQQVHVHLTATVGVQHLPSSRSSPPGPRVSPRPSPPLTVRSPSSSTPDPRRAVGYPKPRPRPYASHGPLDRGSPVPPLSLSRSDPDPEQRARRSRRSSRSGSSGGSVSERDRPLSLVSTRPVSACAPVCVHRAGGSPVSPTSPAYLVSPVSPVSRAEPAVSPVSNPFASPVLSSPTSMVFCASPCSIMRRESRSTYSCSSASYSYSYSVGCSPSEGDSVLEGESVLEGDAVEAEFEFDAVAGPNASFRRHVHVQAQAQDQAQDQDQDQVEEHERVVVEEQRRRRRRHQEVGEGANGQGPIFEAALLKQRRRQYARIRRSLRMAQRGAVTMMNASSSVGVGVGVGAAAASLGGGESAGQTQQQQDPWGYHLPSRMMAMSPYPYPGDGRSGDGENGGQTPFRSGWI